MFFAGDNNTVIYSEDSFFEYMESCGVDKNDLKSFIDETFVQPSLKAFSYYDGYIGDDYYSFCDGINSELNEIDNIIDRLNSKARKNNTKAEIAKELSLILENLRDML